MKTVFLKKVAIFIIAVATMTVSAVAQPKQGDKDAGVNLLFGSTSGWSNIGLGAKFRYNVTDPIRIAGEFDYFLKKNYISFWDFSVYGQYLFPVAEKIVVYPEAGLGYLGSTVNIPGVSYGGITYGGGSSSNGNFALTIGGGADYELTPTLTLNGELRLKFADGNMFNVAIGLAYKF